MICSTKYVAAKVGCFMELLNILYMVFAAITGALCIWAVMRNRVTRETKQDVEVDTLRKDYDKEKDRIVADIIELKEAKEDHNKRISVLESQQGETVILLNKIDDSTQNLARAFLLTLIDEDGARKARELLAKKIKV